MMQQIRGQKAETTALNSRLKEVEERQQESITEMHANFASADKRFLEMSKEFQAFQEKQNAREAQSAEQFRHLLRIVDELQTANSELKENAAKQAEMLEQQANQLADLKADSDLNAQRIEETSKQRAVERVIIVPETPPAPVLPPVVIEQPAPRPPSPPQEPVCESIRCLSVGNIVDCCATTAC